MKLCLLTASALLLGVVAGCGTEVTFVSSGAGASGGSASASNGSGGTTSNSSSSSGVGGGDVCARTQESFDMLLETYDGAQYSCSLFFESSTGLRTIEGEVLESNPGGLVIDECPPTADCVGMFDKLTFSAAGLQNPVPQGAFVHIEVRVDMPMGCSHELLINNLPSWFGVPNPYIGMPGLYLAAADGVATTLPSSPFSIASVPLGCTQNDYDDSYLLRFDSPYATESIELRMGNTADWWLDGPGYPSVLTLKNLRSFETGYADDYWNWGWWAYAYPALTQGE
jgi:hypothetical protein